MLVWLREPKQASERTVDQAVPWLQVTNINWAWHKPGWEWEWAYPTRNPRGGAIVCTGWLGEQDYSQGPPSFLSFHGFL